MSDQPSSRNCPLAVVSLVLGMLVGVTCGLTAIPAIVCGHLALRRIRRDALHGKVLAVVGLVLGYSCLLGVLFHVVLLSAISYFIISEIPEKDSDLEVSVDVIYRRAQENMQAIEDLKAFYRPEDALEVQ